MLIADRSIPVSLTVIFLNLKEKHLIYIIILQNLVMVAPSDSVWLLIRPFFKNCKLRAPPGNPGETLPPRPRVRPPHENSTSILQAFLLPKHVPHCLPVTARSSSPPSGQPAFARCTQTAHCAPRQWQHGGAKRNTNQGGETHSCVHCYQPSSLLAADATSLHDTRSPGCHHLPATQLTWRVLQVPDMGNDMWPQHAHSFVHSTGKMVK